MAHEIDMTNGRANIAWTGERPWHGLGQELTPNTPLETWIKEAGFDWQVESTPVKFDAGRETFIVPDRQVLYRSDTKAPLGVVSTGYKIVQPEEVAEFYRDLIELSGFQMETMGVLRDGKRYWAMARMGDGFKVGGLDDEQILPYVLLATSADGSMATVAHLTSVRVVCQNTLRMSVGEKGENAFLKIRHVTEFDPFDVKEKLGILPAEVAAFEELTNRMAEKRMNHEQIINFWSKALWRSDVEKMDVDDLAQRPNIQTLFGIYNGGAPGQHTEATTGTLWGAMSAMTRWVDHERRARDAEQRFEAAQFGDGQAIKERAMGLARELVA